MPDSSYFTPYTGAVWTQPRRSLSSSARLDVWLVHELRFAMFMRHTLVLVASVSLLGSVARAQTSSYDNVDEIDGPRKSDHWLRDKNRWLEEVKKTTTNHRNES